MSSGDALRLDAKVPLVGRRERLFPGVPLEEWFGRSRAIRKGIIPIVVLVLGPQKGLVDGVESIDGAPSIRWPVFALDSDCGRKCKDDTVAR